MNCPKCGKDSFVIDSRPIESGKVVTRRRGCKRCRIRWTTHESKVGGTTERALSGWMQERKDPLQAGERQDETPLHAGGETTVSSGRNGVSVANGPPISSGNGVSGADGSRARAQADLSLMSGSYRPDPNPDVVVNPNRARVSEPEKRRHQAEVQLAPVIAALAGADFADARDMHDAVEQALFTVGFSCTREVEVLLDDARHGFVDLVATSANGGLRIGLELDLLHPRRKSLRKLNRLDVDLRVVLLRTAPKGRAVESFGMDLVYGLGCTPRDAYSEDFEAIWAEYPRKDNKPAASRAWAKMKPDPAAVRAALSWQRKSVQWTRDNGDFIPHFATYLNNKRWTDKPIAKLTVAPPIASPYCSFHKVGNREKRNPAGTQPGCPECKHVDIRSWTREGDDDLEPAFGAKP